MRTLFENLSDLPLALNLFRPLLLLYVSEFLHFHLSLPQRAYVDLLELAAVSVRRGRLDE